MEKIKICHITTVHPSRYDIRIYEKECRSLAKAGYDVHLIVNDSLDDEVKDGVSIHSLRTKAKNRFDRSSRIAKLALVKALEIDASVYHLHDPELLKIGVKLVKKGKKVIFDSHEFTAMQIRTKPWIPTQLLRNFLSNRYRNYEKRKLNKLSGLVVPCTYDNKDYFKEVNILKEYIANYPSRDSFRFDSSEKKEKKMCYVGSVTILRGFNRMVEVADIAKIPLVLIGDYSDITEEQMNAIKDHPGYKFLEFKGVMSHADTLKEISKCSVGLCLLQKTGQYEHIDTLPTKAYEYMGLGIPTVISDFPYCQRVLDKYQFGLCVDPADAEAIAKAVLSIIDGNVKEMADAGKKAILEEFNWENEADKLSAFYKKVLEIKEK